MYLQREGARVPQLKGQINGSMDGGTQSMNGDLSEPGSMMRRGKQSHVTSNWYV